MSEENQWEWKVWGVTKLIHEDEKFTKHELLVQKGGFCSFHLHRKRWNRFIVHSGEILIVELVGANVKQTQLDSGKVYEVAPNICHQFQVVESGCVVEEYFNGDGSKPDVGDIVRFTTGGMIRNESDLKLFGVILDENQNVLKLEWGIKQ